jgi:hypothetical protein
MQKRDKPVEPTAPLAGLMWNMDPQSIQAMTDIYTAWLSQASRVQEETMRFVQERFSKELDAATQIARCTNPLEAFALQAELAQKRAEDYVEEGQRLASLTGEIAKEISTRRKDFNQA